MAAEQITDHETQVLAKLCQQFVGKTNVEAFLAALASPAQDLENALWALFTQRDIDTAVGQQLDDIGFIVGENRNGRLDDDYRRLIRARISVNRSRGTVEDILTVIDLVLDDATATYTIGDSGGGSLTLRIQDISVTAAVVDYLILYLRATVAAGVRLVLEYTEDDYVADILYMDTDTLDGPKVMIPAVD